MKDLPIDMNKLEKLQILNIQRNMFSDSLPLYRFFQNIDIYIDDYLSILWKSDLKNKSKQISNITIPEEYKCPICYDIMIIPSVNSLEIYIAKNVLSLITKIIINDPYLIPNNNTNIFPIIFLEKN